MPTMFPNELIEYEKHLTKDSINERLLANGTKTAHKVLAPTVGDKWQTDYEMQESLQYISISTPSLGVGDSVAQTGRAI